MEQAILPTLARLGAADPQLAAAALAVCFEASSCIASPGTPTSTRGP